MDDRYDPAELSRFAAVVLGDAGMPGDKAETIAEHLVLADMYGHTTHGLALLSDYVEEIENGDMNVDGDPEELSSLHAVACWDARRLPGVWVAVQAVDEAVQRAERFGIGAVAVRRSHHIACLAAYLEKPARQGFVTLVLSSDPSDAHVAPYGGTTPVMTPNPIAAGIPRSDEPILIDISASITTAGMCARLRDEGKRLPGDWLLDSSGEPTDDPNVLREGGSILPVGGVDYGHKGFALGLLVEVLTQALSGYGRADSPSGWGAGLFVLAIAPQAFGPREDYVRQVDWLTNACLQSPPATNDSPVRLPGQAALRRKAAAEADGLELYTGIADALKSLAVRFHRTKPTPLRPEN